MDESQPLAGRVALVTGGSGGIGAEICDRLAKAGASVAVVYATQPEAAQATAERIEAAGGRACWLGADLRHSEACSQLVAEVERKLGVVDVLVANAGLARVQTVDQVQVADWNEVIDVNLRAPFLLAQSTVSGMQQRGFGRVLFMSSVAAFTGGVVGPHYAASKAGLHGLTHFLASRLASEGVTVNALAPALVEKTGMLPGDPGELSSLIPVGRLGKPHEVASLALAVLTNPYLTNQVLSIDGGMHAR